MAGVPHAGEQHVLCVNIVTLAAYYEVRVFLVGRGFFFTLVYRCAIFHAWAAHAVLDVKFHLRRVCLSVDQRIVSVLIAAKVCAECENVFWRVLVHGRVGRRTYYDDGIA